MMNMGKRVSGGVFLLIAFVKLSVCYGAVHVVGDKTGWTTLGNYDYQAWAASKNFQVGDLINFVYHPEYHNVMQVSQPEYASCNVTKPIVTYATGNDSITITTSGHHYFICGVPGHCQKGQKVDINVRMASDVAPSPSTLVNTSAPVPALSTRDAATLSLWYFVAVSLFL